MVREESHLDDMRAAIRGDFERLAERRGAQELMRERGGQAEDAVNVDLSTEPTPSLPEHEAPDLGTPPRGADAHLPQSPPHGGVAPAPAGEAEETDEREPPRRSRLARLLGR